MSDDKPSYKGYVNRKWVSTPQTRRNHEAIFKKSPYPKDCEDCDCSGEFITKMEGKVCKDCGKFTEYGVECVYEHPIKLVKSVQGEELWRCEVCGYEVVL